LNWSRAERADGGANRAVKYFMCARPAKKDDHLEFFAELGVEVHALDSKLLDGWKPPESPAYKGAHGMRLQKPDTLSS
jgi:hypothetical protein